MPVEASLIKLCTLSLLCVARVYVLKAKAWVTIWLLDQPGGSVKLLSFNYILMVKAAQADTLHDMACIGVGWYN